jgi:hypothetical protein
VKIKIKKNILKEAVNDYRKDNIRVKVAQDNDDGYKSVMSIELDDRIIHQVLTIQPANIGVNKDSEGEKDLRRCYPAKFSDYPEEIKKMQPKPWNTNGNANPTPNRNMVTRFHMGDNALVRTYDINFEILSVKPLDDQEERNIDPYADGVFGSNQMAALSFFREIMYQVGEYIKEHPWFLYSFYGIETDEEMDADYADDRVNKRTKLYLMALRRLKRQLPGEWVVTYPEKGNANQIIFFKCPMGGLNEVSTMAGVAVQGFGAPFSKEEETLIREMYSSAAIMGSGSGRIPAERSPEGHKRYVRIRFTRQGLQNFKPNPYFPSKDQQLGEEWSRSERNKRKSKCSNPKGFTMKQFCKNQRTKSKKGEKKNENKN